MADAIVVLDSSDDDDDSRKRNRKTFNAARKRKIQPTFQDVISIPSKRTHSTYKEKLQELTADQRLSLLPLIASVDTLATPSATPPLQLLASPPRNASASPISADKETNKNENVEKVVKRVKPITILKESDDAWQQARQKRLASVTSQSSTPTPSEMAGNSPSTSFMDLTSVTAAKEVANDATKSPESNTVGTSSTENQMPEKNEEKAPLVKEYEDLLSECRKADPSPDMEKLIETKLLKYYYSVHPDFVKSRGFRKTVVSSIERIRAEPELVYYNLKGVVDELNVRRKSKYVVVTNEENATSAGSSSSSKHTDEQIKKLNKALYILKKRIARLDEMEVDLEDEDSVYVQVERFKKRASQIYEKICDLTGESKNAKRLVKKPIQFTGTEYVPFNRTLQAYVNRTKEFPDYFDVFRMLEHCNSQYNLELPSFELKRIAQDAFVKVGKLLQSRRKTDLYETVAHFTSSTIDPATQDPTLLAKLKENEKKRKKISSIIAKYARAQDDPEMAERLLFTREVEVEDRDEGESENATGNSGENGQVEADKRKNCLPSDGSDENDDDDDDDDEDDEDEENLDAHVEKLTKDNTIELSDADTDTEMNDETSETVGTVGETGVNTEGFQSEVTVETTPSTDTKDDGKIVGGKAQENHEIRLTENNNIVRTKTTESNVGIEERNGILVQGSKRSSVTIVDKDKPIASLTEKLSAKANDNEKRKEVTTKLVKTTAAHKTASNPAKHRTIAEIVISDEE